MPAPKVKAGESQQDYVSRCMSDLNHEYADDAQRAAICYNTYRDSNTAKEIGGLLDRIKKAILPVSKK